MDEQMIHYFYKFHKKSSCKVVMGASEHTYFKFCPRQEEQWICTEIIFIEMDE